MGGTFGSAGSRCATSRYASTPSRASRVAALLLWVVERLKVGIAVLDDVVLVVELPVAVDVDLHVDLADLALVACVRRRIPEVVLAPHEVPDRVHVGRDLARERDREILPPGHLRQRLECVERL